MRRGLTYDQDVMTTERHALTILFADVSGSTRLFETLGDEVARRLISGVLAALSEVTASHGGRVIKTIGDEIMCTFPGSSATTSRSASACITAMR
ncbi:MAG: adenylate/guanylate cyclase domain-containing protein [Dokdonella sp.]